ncbi:zinc finger protein 830-like [Mercenaria mercenaria]|uniref:zinc finger protein 830-like n=1 Tax=Mercenaria mercenaria TaxID=6596 RepID=UPI00234EA319|nr:zinc finger protein 830-like [Mercenaria mercenaria]
MASKKKKIVTKDDLRRLMKEKQSVSKSNTKKIDHPLAKYNSLDQLVCVVCNTVVKSDLLWPAHLQSKPHKEKLEDLKSRETAGVKRKASNVQDTSENKKLKGSSNGNITGKGGLPPDFFDNNKSTALAKQPKSILTNSTKPLLSQYGSSDSEEEEDVKKPANISTQPTKLSSSALPADFFDAGVMPSASTSKDVEEEPRPATMADVLPEGFFDDPKMDAKVRKVEYVDKMEEEWELFQKTMKEETHVSEAIVEEEDEQVNVDRNIDEIDEQIQCWKEVNDLETKKEEIMKKAPVDSKKDNDSDEDLNEEMLDEFLDWRSKKSWR